MNMKQLGVRALLGAAISCPCILATPAAAQVSVGVSISLPPPIVFAAPPQLVVLPGFDIYVAPAYAEEVYYVDGWWWRPWQGHWYRSQSYSSGWGAYSDVPYFYRNVRRDWRDDYRNHRWEGQAWNYEPVSYQRVEQNWSSWKSNKHWQSQNNWGVPNYKGRQQGNDDRRDMAAPQQHHGDRPAVAAPQQQHHSEVQAPRVKSHAAPQKAAKSQHQSAPSMKAAKPQQHHESSPKAVKSHGGGDKPQGQKHSSQPKGDGGSKEQDHGSDSKGHSQGGGQGGGKGKN